MKAPTDLTIQSLSEGLKRALDGSIGSLTPQVRCRLKASSLQVFIQHLKSNESVEQTIYSIVARVLALLKRSDFFNEGVGAKADEVCVYLCLTGHPRPYAGRSLQLKSVLHSTMQYSDSDSNNQEIQETQQRGANPSAHLENEPSPELFHPILYASEQLSQCSISKRPSSQNMSGDRPPSSTFHRPHTTLQTALTFPWNRWRMLPAIAASLALSMIAAGSYALTRPCVVSTCEVIDTARTLSQESQILLAGISDPEKIVTAYEKLIEANYQLSRIPFWSKHHQEAQQLLSTYQVDANLLSQIVTAQRQAYSATLSAQEAPHPLPVWEDIRGKWQAAIAQLQQVPSDTVVAKLAREKLSEYQKNLVTVNQYISREQEAQSKIAAARRAAQLAEAREGIANSVEGWQQVFVTWQVVMDRLAEVPKDTMAFAEAQQLMAIYSNYLTASRDRLTKEQLSYDAYNQAIALAEQAIQEEEAGQLMQAFASWKNALANAQQVPEGTSYYDQTQPLLSSYTEELARIEQVLAHLAAFEEIHPMLNGACNADSPICSFSLGQDSIQIFLADLYDDALRQMLLTGITAAAVELTPVDRPVEMPKVATLLQTITAVGNRTEIRVEVYDHESHLIATYDPELEGYIQSESVSAQDDAL